MEVLVDNRNGKVYEMPLRSITWKTERRGKAGEFEAELIIEDPLNFPIVNGAVVRAMDGKQKIFYGYVFKTGQGKDSIVTVKAYDQLRYLMFNDTFVIPAMTATKAIERIVKRASPNMKIGFLADTGYTVPGVAEDDKKAFDVVSKYLDSTLIATNRNFVLFDNFGELELRDIVNMKLPDDEFYIGEDSLLYDYTYEKSIDDETYNRVKLVHDNEKTGKREVYIAQDSGNIAKWGSLQKFKKVDANMEAAQIQDLANKMIQLHNREIESLDLSCLGDWRVRAGRFIYFYIEKLGISKYFMVDECQHDWNEGIHTMDLKVKVV